MVAESKAQADQIMAVAVHELDTPRPDGPEYPPVLLQDAVDLADEMVLFAVDAVMETVPAGVVAKTLVGAATDGIAAALACSFFRHAQNYPCGRPGCKCFSPYNCRIKRQSADNLPWRGTILLNWPETASHLKTSI
jgi:hypothetical protein